MSLIVVPKTREAAVRQEGTRVVVIVDGRAVLDLPWQAAQGMAKAIMAKAKEAEELASAESIAMDSAILLRAGVPLGLTSHPKILDLARKEAVSNRRLRRAMPGGIKSKTQYGRPAVEVKKP